MGGAVLGRYLNKSQSDKKNEIYRLRLPYGSALLQGSPSLLIYGTFAYFIGGRVLQMYMKGILYRIKICTTMFSSIEQNLFVSSHCLFTKSLSVTERTNIKWKLLKSIDNSYIFSLVVNTQCYYSLKATCSTHSTMHTGSGVRTGTAE